MPAITIAVVNSDGHMAGVARHGITVRKRDHSSVNSARTSKHPLRQFETRMRAVQSLWSYQAERSSWYLLIFAYNFLREILSSAAA
jgi:predicted NAD/FAD-binding protein